MVGFRTFLGLICLVAGAVVSTTVIPDITSTEVGTAMPEMTGLEVRSVEDENAPQPVGTPYCIWTDLPGDNAPQVQSIRLCGRLVPYFMDHICKQRGGLHSAHKAG